MMCECVLSFILQSLMHLLYKGYKSNLCRKTVFALVHVCEIGGARKSLSWQKLRA